jgi:hypothetical protein
MFALLLGHLAGDYLFQNDWMALNKSKRDWSGWLACTTHCVIYSLVVCLFTEMNIEWFCLVFLSHYFIDHYSLGNLVSKLKGNSTLKEYCNKTPDKNTNLNELKSSFAAFVYIAQDNTMHLILMYWGWLFLN